MTRPITDPARADLPPTALAAPDGAKVEHPAPARPATGGPGPRLPARSTPPAGSSAGDARQSPIPPRGDCLAPDPPGGAAVTGPVPSGGATRKRRQRRAPLEPDETQFQKSVTDLAERLGIWWYFNPDSRRSNAGFPDLVLAGKKGTRFRELKTATGKVRPGQQAWGDRLRGGGEDWDVWRPEDMRSGLILRELQEIR